MIQEKPFRRSQTHRQAKLFFSRQVSKAKKLYNKHQTNRVGTTKGGSLYYDIKNITFTGNFNPNHIYDYIYKVYRRNGGTQSKEFLTKEARQFFYRIINLWASGCRIHLAKGIDLFTHKHSASTRKYFPGGFFFKPSRTSGPASFNYMSKYYYALLSPNYRDPIRDRKRSGLQIKGYVQR